MTCEARGLAYRKYLRAREASITRLIVPEARRGTQHSADGCSRQGAKKRRQGADGGRHSELRRLAPIGFDWIRRRNGINKRLTRSSCPWCSSWWTTGRHNRSGRSLRSIGAAARKAISLNLA